MAVLDKINSPKDVKTLSVEEMNTLAGEMRELIINKVNTISGHMGPNLGFVEPTIALHYVFNSPEDKFVFDVSHQCYTHKMLTGRREYYQNPEKYLEISGYTNPNESEHDMFIVGHTSTSVSLATGLAKGRDVRDGKENIIAIIGDGSLSGGEAFEGLDNAAVLGSNIIIVVNDNEMSIAINQGGLYDNLKLLRETKGQAECNFFKSLGFDYRYVENGNDIEELIKAFKAVKDIDHPVVVHLHTLKGKGLKAAETYKEFYHWINAGCTDPNAKSTVETYASLTREYFLKKLEEDKTLVVINPATPGAVDLGQDFRDKMGKNFIDVGIAEEHAMAYISGIAKNGGKPVLTILSSFIQRTYDQISQDLALNNSPATILVNWGGIYGADATHLGLFDIPLISNIPNVVYLAPTCKEEYLKMLDWSIEQKEHTVFIRVPFAPLISTGKEDNTDYSKLNKYQLTEKGEKVAILGLGSYYAKAKEIKAKLQKIGIVPTLINPKYITGLDKGLLEELKLSHKLVITLEEGCLAGGFGEKIASFYGNSNIKVLNYGADKEFPDRVPLQTQLEKYRLTTEQIVKDIQEILK